MREIFENITGLKKYLCLFFLGAVLTLSMPPLGIFPLFFICIPALIWMTRNTRHAFSAFAGGFSFGFGYALAGFYWFGIAFQGLFSQIPYGLPVAILAAPCFMGLYYGTATLLARPFRKEGTLYALAMAAMLFWAEYIRTHFYSDFPWLTFGYGWHHLLPVLQSTAYVGIYGLTFLTLLWSIVPVLLKAPSTNKYLAHGLILSFFFVPGGGAVTLALHPARYHDGVMVRIVQANAAPFKDGKIVTAEEQLEVNLALTKTASTAPIRFMVWAESMVNEKAEAPKTLYKKIAAALPENSYALLGINRVIEEDGDKQEYTSSIILDKQARIRALYDKHHLAPFGEYLPLRWFFKHTPFYPYFLPDRIAGSGAKTLRIEGLPSFSPIICFESIFAGDVVDQKNRPDFLLMQANDIWSMHSVGIYHHFGFARVRSIEEGLPIIRAANTGISAVIDSNGRILQTIGIGKTAVLDSLLPTAAKPTLYSQTGDALQLGFAALYHLILLLIYRRKLSKP
jgi:apolipoprotein N-acyltransferase